MDSLIERNLASFGRDVLDTFPAVVIQGARRVGKSTFATIITAERSAHSFTLDDLETRAAAQSDPQAFVTQYRGETLVIDEIQRLPELMVSVKAAIDRDKMPGRFVLTGSSNLLRMPGVSESLAGRAVTVGLRGLSQGEIAHRCEDFVAVMDAVTKPDTASKDAPEPGAFTTAWTRLDYAEAIVRGGYPEVLPLTDRMRDLWLASYVERLTEHDASDIMPRLSPERLRATLRVLAAQQSGELVNAHLAQAADLPATTITRYLDTLEMLYLVSFVKPWTTNLTKRAVRRRKVGVSDPALAAYLSQIDVGQMSSVVGGEALGALLEGFVATELAKQRSWSAIPWKLYHYRDRDGLEVDFVIEFRDGSVLLIEVKASQTYRAEQFAPMVKLADRLGSRCRGGVVLGTADHGYQYTRNFWGLPVAALWQM